MSFHTIVSKRIRRRRQRHRDWSVAWHVFFGVLSCGVVALMLSGIWYVTRLPAVTITHIEVSGGDTVPVDRVREHIETVLSGSYMRLVPYRFAYTYPHNTLVRAIEAMPRVHDVQVVRTDTNTLRVSFTEYIPVALWCTDASDLNACFFIDHEGYAFAPAPQLDGGSLVRHIYTRGEALHVGERFPNELFDAGNTLIQRLEKEIGFRITSAVYTEDGDIEFFINGGGSLKVALAHDIDTTLTYLASVLASEKFNHLKPGVFQYIDLRFGKKVFVNEVLAPEATTTSEAATTTE